MKRGKPDSMNYFANVWSVHGDLWLRKKVAWKVKSNFGENSIQYRDMTWARRWKSKTRKPHKLIRHVPSPTLTIFLIRLRRIATSHVFYSVQNQHVRAANEVLEVTLGFGLYVFECEIPRSRAIWSEVPSEHHCDRTSPNTCRSPNLFSEWTVLLLERIGVHLFVQKKPISFSRRT